VDIELTALRTARRRADRAPHRWPGSAWRRAVELTGLGLRAGGHRADRAPPGAAPSS
jgi:hypothetical protein